MEWQPIETAPKDEEVLLTYELRGKRRVKSAILTNVWGDNVWSWCVDDNKHGPYPIRGYMTGGLIGWQSLPDPPAGDE